MNAAKATLLALMLCWAFAAAADVAIPPLTGRIVDKTGTLTSQQAAALEQTLKEFETRKGTQVAVLIVSSTTPETIEQYSLRVAEQWKIGRKKIDDGALLVVAKDDRKLRIEVGYGLEGALNDATAKRIIDEIIVPQFKAGNFAEGISAGVDRIIRVVDGEPLPAPSSRPAASLPDLQNYFPVIIILSIMVGGFLRALLGNVPGAVVTGGVVGFFVWLFVGALSIALIAGLIASVFTLVGGGFGVLGMGAGRGPFTGSSRGGFGGGGGRFGGGGGSGSW